MQFCMFGVYIQISCLISMILVVFSWHFLMKLFFDCGLFVMQKYFYFDISMLNKNNYILSSVAYHEGKSVFHIYIFFNNSILWFSWVFLWYISINSINSIQSCSGL